MSVNQTQLSYRRAAIENASSVGLVVILYDMLIEDLRQAVNAIDRKDIEGRSGAVKHAFLVLQQLEGSLDRENGGEAATNLSKFYGVMRGRILEAHMKINSDILNEQVGLLLDVRQAWEQVDPAKPTGENRPAALPPEQPAKSLVAGEEETTAASWTA